MKRLRYALLNFGVIWLLLKGAVNVITTMEQDFAQYKLNDRDLYVLFRHSLPKQRYHYFIRKKKKTR